MSKIIFTGGGSPGHVIPNFAIIAKCQAQGIEVGYIGSANGIEKKLVQEKQIPYFAIASGKLRRYFSLQNFIDPFKVVFGIVQSYFILGKQKPSVVFSKGGFVSLPVVFAAWLRKIPVVAHESDLTPGLANKLCLPFVKKLCLTFPEAVKFFKDKTDVIVTGTPIRQEFFDADADKGRQFLGFNANKKILLVIGGGLGAQPINEVIWKNAQELTKKFQIVHCCGHGKTNADINVKGYVQFEYLREELFDVMACVDVVISRAGANTLYELLALHKPHILIPLPKGASRGDQIHNAHYFEKMGMSKVILQENLSSDSLLEMLIEVNANFAIIKQALMQYQLPDATQAIINVLEKYWK